MKSLLSYTLTVSDTQTADKLYTKTFKTWEAAQRAALDWIYKHDKKFDDHGADEYTIIEWFDWDEITYRSENLRLSTGKYVYFVISESEYDYEMDEDR